jgi:hypothetical protein
VDERSERRWRSSLARTLARRVKAWADAVLSKPAESLPAPQEEETPPNAGPPTGWLKEAQGLRAGPPADWMEFVRRHGASGPRRMANGAVAPRAASPEPPVLHPSPSTQRAARMGEGAPAPVPLPPTRERSEGTREASWASSPPQGSPSVSELPPPPRVARQAEAPGAPALEQPGTSTPLVAPAPVFQPPRAEHLVDRPVPRPQPREDSSAVPPRSEGPAPVLRPASEPRPPAPRFEPRAPAEPEGTRASVPLEERTLTPTPPRLWRSENRLTASAEPHERPAVAYPWGEEPGTERRAAPAQEPQEDLQALITRSWPALAEAAEPKRATPPRADPEPFEAHRSGPWPELPEPPPAESPEAVALLRQWERLSRLDREQRGE